MSKLIPNINVSHFKLDEFDTGTYSSSSKEDICLKQLQKEFDAFERIDYSNPRHKKELDAMFPKWLIENANPVDLELFQMMSRYYKKHNTFVAGVFNNGGDDLKFELISHKLRRVGKIKWMTRKGTHPNNMPFVRIYRDNTPIYVVEGHHDMLTAILLGLDFIMIPTAGFRDANIIKDALLDASVVFIVEDERAYHCMFGLALQIEDVVKRITLLKLSNEQKYELSDFAMGKNSIEEVNDGLKNK